VAVRRPSRDNVVTAALDSQQRFMASAQEDPRCATGWSIRPVWPALRDSAEAELESAQERDQVGFVLRRQDEAEAAFVKMHDV